MMIWTTVSFGLLVLLLYKTALPPLLAFLAAREKQIADALATAETERQASARLLQENKKQLAEINRKAEALIEQARSEGQRTRDEIVQNAGLEAKRLLEKAKFELEREKQGIVTAARREITELVIETSAKVLRRSLTGDDDRKLVEAALAESK